jgi:micrococcal nuclease
MRANYWKCLLSLAAALSFAACSPHGYHPSYRGAKPVALADVRFDDGDTFFIKGKPIRVLGIDTPEIAHAALGIHEGQPYGEAAAESTRVMLTRAKRIEYVSGGRDRYRRTLAHIFVDGELLAVRLIRMGLAYETVSYYGDSGFPDLAQRIVDASRAAPKPKFEAPYKWKRRQRKARESQKNP